MNKTDPANRAAVSVANRKIARPYFESQPCDRGRVGALHLIRDGVPLPPVHTPVLYPVVNLITGTTPNGGGIWGYICNQVLDFAKYGYSLPIMTEALHFLTYRLRKVGLDKWRAHPLRDHYKRYRTGTETNGHGPVDFRAPLFIDSGGFRLLQTPSLVLNQYNLLTAGSEADSILELQADYGADIVASLDYPLPPNLAAAEADERMRKSAENALHALELLANSTEYLSRRSFSPYFYIACHGLSEQAFEKYVCDIFEQIMARGLPTDSLGIAVGSLVPLRGAGRHVDLVRLIRGAVRGIPAALRPTVPIHVFGISGDLIPLLVYLGVDSFDSSTYVRQSQSLSYYHPDEKRYVRLLEQENWDHLPCECQYCREMGFEELHQAFGERAEQAYHKQETGKFKSAYYAAIALHNLEMELDFLRRTREAQEAGCLVDFFVEYARDFPRMQEALLELAREDDELAARVTRVVYETAWKQALQKHPLQSPLPRFGPAAAQPAARPTISLRFTPDDFRVPRSFEPPPGKDILLVIPCSDLKPYSASRSHKTLQRRLSKELGADLAGRIHKVTLSGLYGPVPEEYEEHESVLHYNFLLTPLDRAQIAECSSRLRAYLERYKNRYEAMFGYATTKAYRTVLDNVATVTPNFRVYPNRDRQNRRGLSQLPTEFYRKENVAELVEAIKEAERSDARSQGKATLETGGRS